MLSKITTSIPFETTIIGVWAIISNQQENGKLTPKVINDAIRVCITGWQSVNDIMIYLKNIGYQGEMDILQKSLTSIFKITSDIILEVEASCKFSIDIELY